LARWLDLCTWAGPTVNEGDGDGRPGEPEDLAVECRGLVLHIAQGTYAGTIGWEKNPVSEVSSHFIFARDGRRAQVVDTDVRAWTQRLGNGHWLSSENEGFLPDALTAAQIESNAQVFARGHLVYGYPLQIATSPTMRGLGHHSMGAESGIDWGHSACPGESIKAQKAAIVARAIDIVQGDGMAEALPANFAINFDQLVARVAALFSDKPAVDWSGAPLPGEVNALAARLARIEAASASVDGVSEARLRELIRDELDRTRLAAVG